MVFVDAHAFEAEFVRQLQFVEIAVVQRMAELGIVEGVGTRDSGAVMLLGKILGEMSPGHEVKAVKSHVQLLGM
jgi:hypothetical protein